MTTTPLDSDAEPARDDTPAPAPRNPFDGAHASVPPENGSEAHPPNAHVYDDIVELDNELPRWWLNVLYATIVFAIAYWFHFQVFIGGRSPRQEYDREMASVYAAEAARLRAAGAITPEALRAMSRDPATVAQGAQVFSSNCAACHGAQGGGQIGPNLTDAFWLHGGRPEQIFRTVNEGQPTRGMPAWGPQLGTDRVTAAVAYLLTIRNTNVTGRPPQGTRED